MKNKAPLTLILILIALLFLSLDGNSQSFYSNRGYSSKGAGHDNQCHAVHQKKTVGQKLRNKVKYAKKRHNNDWFAYKERQRKLKLSGYATK